MSQQEPLLSLLLKISLLEKKGRLTELGVNQQLQFLLKNGFQNSEILHEVLVREELSYLREIDFMKSMFKNSDESNKVYLAVDHVENIQSDKPLIQLAIFILKMIRYHITKQPITAMDINTWQSRLKEYYLIHDQLNSKQKEFLAESAELLARYASLTDHQVFGQDLSKLIEATLDHALIQHVSQFEEQLMQEINNTRTSLPYQKSEIGFLSELKNDRHKESHFSKVLNRYQSFMNKGLVKLSGNPYQRQNIGFTCQQILKN